MSQLSKPKEFWTNWMSMHDNLDDAKDNQPKAEWEDLRCYVAYEDYENQRAVIEKLEEKLAELESNARINEMKILRAENLANDFAKELSQMNSRMIDEKAKVANLVNTLNEIETGIIWRERTIKSEMDIDDAKQLARKTLAELEIV